MPGRSPSVLLVIGFWMPAVASVAPPGFRDDVVVSGDPMSGVAVPTAVRFHPQTGDLWITEKGDGMASGTARVRVRGALSGSVATALLVTCVDSEGERGLLDLAFDPDFAASRFVYLFYTRRYESSGPCFESGQSSGARNIVTRWSEASGALAGETPILRGPLLESIDIHNGGTIRFAADSTLLVSMGDNGMDPFFTPVSRDLGDLRGKILRINRDGTIPIDNPFVDTGGARPEIWALGLRNPFRFTVHPSTGTVFLTDVGEAGWEEIDLGVPGADYGWPCYEAGNPYGSCAPLPMPGDLTFPIFAYSHVNLTPPVKGRAILGGPIYNATAFPPDYQGSYFFADYVAGWIRRAKLAPGDTLEEVEIFLTGAEGPVDLAVGPDGCLYYASILLNEIHKVCYVGGSNGQPEARAMASPASGPAPLEVFYNGKRSSDPDGDGLSFSWNLGDGSWSPHPWASHIYADMGIYQATLTVSDRRGEANSLDSSAPLRIVVGNNSPIAAISSPAPGTRYKAGETVIFTGTASDPEDGALGPPAFSWMIIFHHNSHTHPFLGPLAGITSSSFTIPSSGEQDPNVAYEIRLQATDSGDPLGSTGRLAAIASLKLEPQVSRILVVADPPGSGLKVEFDGRPLAAPHSQLSVAGWPRVLGTGSPQSFGGRTFTFDRWSDSGAISHSITTPESDTTYTARFICPTLTDPQDLRAAPALGGKIRLTWQPSFDLCHQDQPGFPQYAIYRAFTARPMVPPGDFPVDPAFELIGTSPTTGFTFTPGPGTEFYLVLDIGRDGQVGPAGHY